jgi:hypothetical protein
MKRFLLVGVVLALICAADGTASSPNRNPIAAARERSAVREAKALLHRFVAPPGAVHTQRPPGYGGVLLRSGPTPLEKLVDRHTFWRVAGSVSSVFSYVRANRPSGFHVEDMTRSSPGQSPANAEVSYSRQGTRFLNVAVVQLPGRIVIRVDAKAVWFYPRSALERVPHAVRSIVVRAPNEGPTRSWRVADPADVAKIARWFDALPVRPPDVVALCGASVGPGVELVFRSTNGTRLASASVPTFGRAGVCDEMSFTIHGKQQIPLIDWPHGRFFVVRLQRLLGVRLTPSR